jgi:hypothetical protein
MFRHLLSAAMLAVVVLVPPGAKGEDLHRNNPDPAPELALSPKLRGALRAEMAGLKAGIAELSVALAGGEWDKAAERAGRIRDSYILKQRLSRGELEQLERSLPADFLDMDERFHRHAGRLASAAHMQDHELAVFYFARMLEACGSCHVRYATHTFPGYRSPPAPHAH